jgi:hypothetical protein
LYPDFFQVVSGAQDHRFDPGGRETNGYELGADFQPTAKVRHLPLYPSGRLFLAAALAGVPMPLAMVITRIADTPLLARSHATWMLRAGSLPGRDRLTAT